MKGPLPSLGTLENSLGYFFQDPRFLTVALTHRSCGNQHNERLEFLGDSVLNCVIASILFERFPELPEGDLSRLRSHLVKQDTLYSLAQQLSLGQFLLLGEGETRSGGDKRPSILADALEAIFGAIYRESGFDTAFGVISRLFEGRVAQLLPGVSLKDPKTRLQEWLQAHRHPLPQYRLRETTGAAHDQCFLVACHIENLNIVTQGKGNSRRLAEQSAAQQALAGLEAKGIL